MIFDAFMFEFLTNIFKGSVLLWELPGNFQK